MTPRAPLALTAAAAVLLAGCSTAERPAPTQTEVTEIRWQIIGGDAVVATFCDHGNRVYAFDDIAVVPADPSCAGGAR